MCRKLLTELSMANRGSEIPSTVVIASTSGFEQEVNEMAEQRADRTLILVQPNEVGGWKATGPVETKALVDLFDPEGSSRSGPGCGSLSKKMSWILMSSGLATDKVAAKTQLPLQFVEQELKSYAKDKPGLNRPSVWMAGLSCFAKAFQARTTRKVTKVQICHSSSVSKHCFRRRETTRNKIAFLSERRAALSQQQDRIYEDLNKLESTRERSAHAV